MCWACDHPDATWDDYLDHLLSLVSWHGWTIQGVERDGIRPPRAYTVGLTKIGKPELVVTGMAVTRAATLLNEVAAHLSHADPPAVGEVVELTGGPAIQLLGVDAPEVHLTVAVQIYGSGVRGLQVVHADERGRWPWQAGYRGIRGGQPVLGSSELRAAS